jgi:hypothetical protein
MSAIIIVQVVENNIMSKKKLEFTEEEIANLIDLIDVKIERSIIFYMVEEEMDLLMTIKNKLLDYEGKSNILEAKEEL